MMTTLLESDRVPQCLCELFYFIIIICVCVGGGSTFSPVPYSGFATALEALNAVKCSCTCSELLYVGIP